MGIETIALLAAGALTGLFIGWVSFVAQKWFVATLGTGLLVVFVGWKAIIARFALVAGVPEMASPVTAAGWIYNNAPMDVQNALALGFIAVFVGRIGTWWQARKEKPEETKQEFRARILAEYGMRDPLA